MRVRPARTAMSLWQKTGSLQTEVEVSTVRTNGVRLYLQSKMESEQAIVLVRSRPHALIHKHPVSIPILESPNQSAELI